MIKCKLRIPTNQFGFVEAEVETIDLPGAIDLQIIASDYYNSRMIEREINDKKKVTINEIPF